MKPNANRMRGVQLLDDRIAAGEERAGEIEREGGVGVEVVPLDEVADRADEDRLQPAPHVGDVESVLRRSRVHGQGSPSSAPAWGGRDASAAAGRSCGRSAIAHHGADADVSRCLADVSVAQTVAPTIQGRGRVRHS